MVAELVGQRDPITSTSRPHWRRATNAFGLEHVNANGVVDAGFLGGAMNAAGSDRRRDTKLAAKGIAGIARIIAPHLPLPWIG